MPRTFDITEKLFFTYILIFHERMKKMKKSLVKRIVSGVTSALLALSAFAQSVPLGNSGLLRARAATNLSGGSDVDDVTLLVGSNPKDPDGKPYDKFDSVEAAIEQYNMDLRYN